MSSAQACSSCHLSRETGRRGWQEFVAGHAEIDLTWAAACIAFTKAASGACWPFGPLGKWGMRGAARRVSRRRECTRADAPGDGWGACVIAEGVAMAGDEGWREHEGWA